MTIVSTLISDAFRQSNLLALGVSPTSAQEVEALRFLNRIVKSVFGNEAGEQLTAFPVGRGGIERPSGYPWYDTVPDSDWFVPKNTRLMLNLSSVVHFYLHPAPDDGSRFALIDVSNNLSTYPTVIHGNGRLIDGATTLTINTSGTDAEWFYREDLANWLKYAPLLLTDVFPFPEEFDDFFITMLAVRLNPSYGAALDGQSEMMMTRARKQLQARYTQNIPTHSELGLIRPAKVAVDRDEWGSYYSFYSPDSMFNKGWPY